MKLRDHIFFKMFMSETFNLCTEMKQLLMDLDYYLLFQCFMQHVGVNLGPDHVQMTKVNWRLKVN